MREFLRSLATTLKSKLVGRRVLKSKKTGLPLFWKWVKHHSNYYRLHLGYFLAMMFIGAGIIMATEPRILFEDALFIVTSAVNVNGTCLFRVFASALFLFFLLFVRHKNKS
jgi:hypothetical protein